MASRDGELPAKVWAIIVATCATINRRLLVALAGTCAGLRALALAETMRTWCAVQRVMDKPVDEWERRSDKGNRTWMERGVGCSACHRSKTSKCIDAALWVRAVSVPKRTEKVDFLCQNCASEDDAHWSRFPPPPGTVRRLWRVGAAGDHVWGVLDDDRVYDYVPSSPLDLDTPHGATFAVADLATANAAASMLCQSTQGYMSRFNIGVDTARMGSLRAWLPIAGTVRLTHDDAFGHFLVVCCAPEAPDYGALALVCCPIGCGTAIVEWVRVGDSIKEVLAAYAARDAVDAHLDLVAWAVKYFGGCPLADQ